MRLLRPNAFAGQSLRKSGKRLPPQFLAVKMSIQLDFNIADLRAIVSADSQFF
jgi:hypothetical protein